MDRTVVITQEKGNEGGSNKYSYGCYGEIYEVVANLLKQKPEKIHFVFKEEQGPGITPDTA